MNTQKETKNDKVSVNQKKKSQITSKITLDDNIPGLNNMIQTEYIKRQKIIDNDQDVDVDEALREAESESNLSKKDRAQQKIDIKQAKKRANDKYNEFIADEYLPTDRNIKLCIESARRFANYDFTAVDQSTYQLDSFRSSILIDLIEGNKVKVKSNYNDFDGVRIEMSYHIMKSVHIKGANRNWDKIIDITLNHITDEDLDKLKYNKEFKNYKTASEFTDSPEHEMFIPAFVIKDVDEELKYRIYSECNQVYRLSPKMQYLCLFLSCNNWPELRTPKWFKVFFKLCTSDPFSLDRSNRCSKMYNTSSAMWFTFLMNMLIAEMSIKYILDQYKLGDIIDEVCSKIFDDNPNIFIRRMSDGVCNTLRMILFTFIPKTVIPSFSVETGKVTSAYSYRDNLTNYNALREDMIKYCTSEGLNTLRILIELITKVPDRDMIALTCFVTGIGNMAGYCDSERFASVQKQIYRANRLLRERYNISDEEAYNVALQDFENPILKNDPDYEALKKDYFDNERYKYDYLPKDFNYNNCEMYQSLTRHIYDVTFRICAQVPTHEQYDIEGVINNVFNWMTPKNSGQKLRIQVPDIRNKKVLKSQNRELSEYTPTNLRENVAFNISAKSAIICFIDIKSLVSPENIREKYFITGGIRKVPAKQARLIHNIPMGEFVKHQCVADGLFKAMDNDEVFKKTTGRFIEDYWILILTTSKPEFIGCFFDCGTFDGSCKNMIQHPIYCAFKDSFKKLYDSGKHFFEITIGDLLDGMQDNKYRAFLDVYYAGKREIHIADIIYSGELLTNYKDSMVNYGLVASALDFLFDMLSEIISGIVNSKDNDDKLKINGDDSIKIIELTSLLYKVDEIVKNGDYRYIKCTYDKRFLDILNKWGDSLPDIFGQVGFVLSSVKGGIMSNYVEYLKVWFVYGMYIANWRLQFCTQEKPSILSREYALSSYISVLRSMVERGYRSDVLFRFAILICNNAGVLKTSRFDFFGKNYCAMFAPIRNGGLNMPNSSSTFAFPSSTLKNSYDSLRTMQNGVQINKIHRRIRECFLSESLSRTAYAIAKLIDEQQGMYISSTFEPVILNKHLFNSTLNEGLIHKSFEAYKILKEHKLKFSESNIYGNLFVKKIASGISSSNNIGANWLNLIKTSNYTFMLNLREKEGTSPLNFIEMVCGCVTFDVINYNEYSYKGYLDNVGICSDPTFFYFKYILGYSDLTVGNNFEPDLVKILKRAGVPVPPGLSSDVLLPTLTDINYISDRYIFNLACVAFGLTEDASTILFEVISENYLLYQFTQASEKYSSVSQVLNMYDFSRVNLFNVFNSSILNELPKYVSYAILTLGILYISSNLVVNYDARTIKVPQPSMSVDIQKLNELIATVMTNVRL